MWLGVLESELLPKPQLSCSVKLDTQSCGAIVDAIAALRRRCSQLQLSAISGEARVRGGSAAGEPGTHLYIDGQAIQ